MLGRRVGRKSVAAAHDDQHMVTCAIKMIVHKYRTTERCLRRMSI